MRDGVVGGVDPVRTWLRPGQTLQAKVQHILLIATLVDLMLGVPLVLLGSGRPTPLREAALAGVIWLTLWWSRGYWRDEFHWWGDLLSLVAMVLVSLGAPTPADALAVLYAGLCFRTFYGGRWIAAALAGGLVGGTTAASLLEDVGASGGPELQHLLPGAVAVVVIVVAAQILRHTIDNHREAMLRERMLRLSSTDLLAAESAEAVYRTVRRAVQAVAAPSGGAVAVALGVPHGAGLLVFAPSPLGVDLVRRRTLAERDLQPGVLKALVEGSPLNEDQDLTVRVASSLLPDGAGQHLQLLQLAVERESFGVLAISTGQPCSDDLLGAFRVLADECSLALLRVTLAESLARREARFRSLVLNSSDLILALDKDESVTYCSPSVEPFLGDGLREGERLDLAPVMHPDDVADFEESVRRAIDAPWSSRKVECRLKDRDGSWRHLEVLASNLVDDPDVRAVVLTAHDVTERKQLEEQLRHQALHDPLTGLANRVLLTDRILQALRGRRRKGHQVALLSLDLDDFKDINDSLGHGAGDATLLQVAQRVEDALRPTDTFARLGGDEFAILVDDVAGAAGAGMVAERILGALSTPLSLPDRAEVTVSASLGIVIPAARESDPAVLLRDADIALYAAKREGKNRYVVFRKELHEQAVERLRLEMGLRHALRNGEFRLAYQPLLSAVRHRIQGAEALLRWDDPERGPISPQDFIPVAESTGQIVEIGRWVLREACRQLSDWRSRGVLPADFAISVNVSAFQLLDGLKQDVEDALSEFGVPPSQLVLEVTESMIISNIEKVRARLVALRKLGVKISIDDFGTGQSSLAQVQGLPVDQIKIDRAFISGMSKSQAGAAVVRSVVDLGRALSMEVVAEGVETEAEVAIIESLSSESRLQGFFFAEPLHPMEMELLLLSEGAQNATDAATGEVTGTEASAINSAPLAV